MNNEEIEMQTMAACTNQRFKEKPSWIQEFWSKLKIFLESLLSNRKYEICMLVICLIDGALVLQEYVKAEEKNLDSRGRLEKEYLNVCFYIGIILTALFTLELAFKLIAFGLRSFMTTFLWVDLTIIVVTVVNDAKPCAFNMNMNFARFWRIVRVIFFFINLERIPLLRDIAKLKQNFGNVESKTNFKSKLLELKLQKQFESELENVIQLLENNFEQRIGKLERLERRKQSRTSKRKGRNRVRKLAKSRLEERRLRKICFYQTQLMNVQFVCSE